MEVRDGHAGIRTDVEGEAVSALGKALVAGDLLGEDEQPGENFGVAPIERAGVVDVLLRDEEDVDWRPGVDITDGEGMGVFGDLGRGHLTRVHPAEEAIGHHGADSTAGKREAHQR